MNDIFYVEGNGIENNSYIYNQRIDIIYKIKPTRIGKYKVHSIEELDAMKSDGIREKQYKRIQYEVEYKTIGSKSYYEPDLNGFNEETTKLVFYKVNGNDVTSEEYLKNATDWLNEGRPNEITLNSDKYVLYDYENKIWANVRVLNSGIETYWTWIPRYAFKNDTIDSVPTTQIEFVSLEDNIPQEYKIGPAFDGNNKKGIWNSKYEPKNKVQNVSKFSYYIPDLTNFDKENTYICLYNKEEDRLDKEVKASEITNLSSFSKSNLWFDYDNQIWANIKVVKNGIETWWVWIPRYVVNPNGGVSDIVFVDIYNKAIDGTELTDAYKVAGAFEGNTKRGMWVSKYEPKPVTSEKTNEISSLPDLSNFDENNTFLEIYDKTSDSFVDEVKYKDVKSNLEKFAKNNLWFEYENQIWANIKVVKNGIETWWVWIPRYAVNPGGQVSDIILIDENNNPLNGEELPNAYKVAGAFEGNNKLGMWVSKYQPSEQ